MDNPTPKLRPDVKARWLAALRGPDYSQAEGQLRTDEGFCCYGVLADIEGPRNGGHWEIDAEHELPHTYVFMWQGTYEESLLPPNFLLQLCENPNGFDVDICRANYLLPCAAYDELKDDERLSGGGNDVLACHRGQEVPLSVLNDNGFSFVEIADLIERYL